MFWRKIDSLQLCFCVILTTLPSLSRGLDKNSTNMQSLLDELTSENGTDLLHSNLNNIFESSISNDSKDEFFIKKNLYIFPVNAPDLMISQKHEIHTVPVANATNATDDEPVTELQDIHEISLSKLQSVNNSQENTENNKTNLMAPNTLEIVSGYKPGLGLITKKFSLPPSVSKSVILPQNSIADLLSFLNETAKEEIAKREVNKSKPELSSDFLTTLSHESRANINEATGSEMKAFVPKEESINEDMDVAEDIVFRPLFRYRQETRLRPQFADDAVYRSSNRRRNQYRYGDYDNYYYPPYRYRPWFRSDNNVYN